jgi:hypothetical protein
MRAFVHCLRLLLCVALVASGPALPHAHAHATAVATEAPALYVVSAPSNADTPCHAVTTAADAPDRHTAPDEPTAYQDGQDDCCAQGQCHCAVMHPSSLAAAHFVFASRIAHASLPIAPAPATRSLLLDEPQRPPIV